MKKILTVTAAAALAVLSFAPVTWAGDVEGTLKSVDASGRVLMLEDGTRLMIPPTVQVERKSLQPGAQVKASFEDRAGEKVITAIEVQPAATK